MAARKISGPSGAHVSPRIKVSVDAERLARWEAAAEGAGVSLAVWLRRLADTAASSPKKSTRTTK